MIYSLPYNTYIISKQKKDIHLIRSEELSSSMKIWCKDGWKKVKLIKVYNLKFVYRYITNSGIIYSFEKIDKLFQFSFDIDKYTYKILDCFNKINNKSFLNIKIEDHYKLKIVLNSYLFLDRCLLCDIICYIVYQYGIIIDNKFIIDGIDIEIYNLFRLALSSFGIRTIFKDNKLIVRDSSHKESKIISIDSLSNININCIQIDINSNSIYNDGFYI